MAQDSFVFKSMQEQSSNVAQTLLVYLYFKNLLMYPIASALEKVLLLFSDKTCMFAVVTMSCCFFKEKIVEG